MKLMSRHVLQISESVFLKAKTAERESAAGRFKQQEISPFASESCTDFHWMCSHSIYGPKKPMRKQGSAWRAFCGMPFGITVYMPTIS